MIPELLMKLQVCLSVSFEKWSSSCSITNVFKLMDLRKIIGIAVFCRGDFYTFFLIPDTIAKVYGLLSSRVLYLYCTPDSGLENFHFLKRI